jgi:hypothetical protein
VFLEWENAKASQLVYIEEKPKYTYSSDDLDIVDLAREFEEIQSFIEEFSGKNYQESSQDLSQLWMTLNDPYLIEIQNKEKENFWSYKD